MNEAIKARNSSVVACHVYMGMCICVYVCICVCTCVCVCTRVSESTHVRVCCFRMCETVVTRACIYVHACTRVDMHVLVFVCAHVHVWAHACLCGRTGKGEVGVENTERSSITGSRKMKKEPDYRRPWTTHGGDGLWVFLPGTLLGNVQGVRYMMEIGQDRWLLTSLEQVGRPRGRACGRDSGSRSQRLCFQEREADWGRRLRAQLEVCFGLILWSEIASYSLSHLLERGPFDPGISQSLAAGAGWEWVQGTFMAEAGSPEVGQLWVLLVGMYWGVDVLAGDRNLGKAPTAPTTVHGIFTNFLSSLRIWGSNLMVGALMEETSFFSIL